MVEVGRLVDGLKAAGVEFFAAVPVELLYGCYCTDRVRPFSPDQESSRNRQTEAYRPRQRWALGSN